MSSSAKKALPVAAIAIATVAFVVGWKLREKRRQVASAEETAPTKKIYAGKDEVSKALCQYIADSAQAAIAARGSFHLAVAGGSLLDSLANLSDHKKTVDFSKVFLSFANHKCVALDSDKSNLHKAKDKFATAAGIKKFVTPSPWHKEGSDGSAEADFYIQALKKAGVPHNSQGLPEMDLILLGLGADGHVASCHPMGSAVKETTKAVVGSPKVGEPSSMTFSIETMNAARQVAVVVCGDSKGKKEAVKRSSVRPAEEPRGTFPAQSLKSPVFYLDAEAAADL